VRSGQLTITATPTVFELGENAFDLVLSDGTDSSTYELTISVQDNPTSYSYIDIEQDTLRGNWQLSDGQKVFLAPIEVSWPVSRQKYFRLAHIFTMAGCVPRRNRLVA
jgi:hypothetical protein